MILRDGDESWEPDDDDEDEDEVREDDLDECPRCGRSIYDDSERCPRCGHYLSRETDRRRHPWWVVAGVAVCLVMVVRWILFL